MGANEFYQHYVKNGPIAKKKEKISKDLLAVRRIDHMLDPKLEKVNPVIEFNIPYSKPAKRLLNESSEDFRNRLLKERNLDKITEEELSKLENKIGRELSNSAEKAKKLRTDRLKKVSKLKAKKNAKIAAGIGAGLTLAGTGAYLTKKHYDKKKSEKKD